MSEREYIAHHFDRSIEVLEKVAADRTLHTLVGTMADAVDATFLRGGRLYLAGNGGSAADAQHIAAEFVSRLVTDRQPLPAIALTTDTSVLTAVANDYGFEHVFERQVLGLGHRGDLLWAISTSGESRNILAALTAARRIGMTTFGFSGATGGTMASFCDHCLRVPSVEVAIIQQVHIVVAHVVCGIVERRLLFRTASGTDMR
jgi:D-sedoheptulose 7-phosphate isomerase